MLLLLLIQTPWAQRQLTTRAEDYLREQLQTDLGIGHIGLGFPHLISLRDVYLNHPKGDSLFRLGELGLDVRLLPLLRREVVVTGLELSGVYGRVLRTDSTSNLDFLLDVFASDTTQTAPPEPEAPSQPWEIRLDDARLDLQNFDLYYQDDPAGLLLEVQLREGLLRTANVDLLAQRYPLHELQLKGAHIALRLSSAEAPDEPEVIAQENAALWAASHRILLEDVELDFAMDSLSALARLSRLQAGGLEVESGDSPLLRLPALELLADSLRYDRPHLPVREGLDPNHIALGALQLDLADAEITGDVIDLSLRRLECAEVGGLALREVKADFHYEPAVITIADALLRTDHTRIEAPEVRYRPEPAASSRLNLDARTSGYLGMRDVLTLFPEANRYALLHQHPDRRFDFATRIYTEADQLHFPQLEIYGPGLLLQADGQARNSFDPDSLRVTAALTQLSMEPRKILPFLPRGAVPDYIDWPDRVAASGNFSYRENRLEAELSAREERAPTARMTQLIFSGWWQPTSPWEQAPLEVKLDTLVGDGATLYAYLPPGTLPAGYRLPDYVQASGSVAGTLEDLTLDLHFGLPENTTFAHLNGQVRYPTDPDRIELDVKLRELALRQADVEPLLPDSLLPSGFRLPDLRVEEAKVQGRLDDLQFRIPLRTGQSRWLAEGRYNPRDLRAELRIDGLRAVDFATGALRDTLAGLNLQPLTVRANIDGRLEPSQDARIQAQISERQRGDLLKLDARLTDTVYNADLVFDHPALRGRGTGRYRPLDSLPNLIADLELEEINMERWGLAQRPLTARGAVSVEARGLRADQFEGRLTLDDVLLRSEDATSFLDSLWLEAEFVDGNNQATVRSDVVTGDLRGEFDPANLGAIFANSLRAYWTSEEQPIDSLEGKKWLRAGLRVHNPRPFTSGLIPGLEELSPMDFNVILGRRDTAFHVDADIPRLRYQGIELDRTLVYARGDQAQLKLNGSWEVAAFGEDVLIGRTVLTAESMDSGLEARLQVYAGDTLRHELAATYQATTDGGSIRLGPEQLLNFRGWNLPPENRISWTDSSLQVNRWRMSQGDRAIELTGVSAEELAVDFQRFDLRTISRLINSEEPLVAGILKGTVHLHQPLEQPFLEADLEIDQLAFRETPIGNMVVDVVQNEENLLTLDAQIMGAGNDLSLQGTYQPDGPLDARLNISALKMGALEPFSLGYLRESEGRLTGRLDLTGAIDQPRIAGDLTFREAALTVGMLGSRFRLEDQRISFREDHIHFNDFTLVDDKGDRAVVNGEVDIRRLTNAAFDLRVRARDFLALDSDAEDNDLFYGRLLVDADVEIKGNAQEPRILVTAEPKGNSNLTYAYSATQGSALVSSQGVVTFAETYEWQGILETGRRDTLRSRSTGSYLETKLRLNDKLRIKVIIDPITQQAFAGRGEGSLTFTQYPNGRQELTGRLEMQSGAYDMVLEGLQRYTFQIRPGSEVYFTGDPANPRLDLQVVNKVRTAPFPLVDALLPNAPATGLRRSETFEVQLNLTGSPQGMNIGANILYPDAYNNRGLEPVEQALAYLRQDQSRMYTTAITLVTFKSFVIPLVGGASGQQNGIVNGLAGAVSGALTALVNQRLGFVQVDLGVENYETAPGEENYNLRLSLSKSFLNDRLIVSVDGVTNTADDLRANERKTYLDNVSVEYLLDEKGQLRIKLFNDYDRNLVVGDNVLRFGGRLVFSKDFDRFFWEKNSD